MTDARKLVQLKTLEERRREYKLRALNKYITEANTSSLIHNDFLKLKACESSVVTRSASASIPLTMYTSTNSYQNSFLLMTTRDWRLA